ncbi:MAG: hypothetical protein HZA53_16075 [Planctomycetes bacterium]|nr:hypothetical protein [Planctomycetota bacterium]
MTGLATRWASQFYATLGDNRAAADELREASLRSDLARWTAALTAVVARTVEALGLSPTAKGFPCTVLPVKRSEYLGQDVMAFEASSTGWKFPVAVCELENSTSDDLVAYSLWKVLCVRCGLRVVLCYRPEADAAAPLVAQLAGVVVSAMPIAERSALSGETLVVVGSRNEASTFPYGFFQAWKLNPNTGRFERFARQ